MFKKRMWFASLIVCLACHSVNAWAYYTQEGRLYDDQNHILSIDGVNWAGFQDSQFVDELYGDIPFYPLSDGLGIGVMDMLIHPWLMPGQTGVSKENSVAFKTIRLPIQPKTIVDQAENTHFRFDLTNQSRPSEGNGVFCAKWGDRYCTQGLSVKESLYRLLTEFKNNHVRVLVDIHQSPTGRNGKVVTTDYSLQQYGENIASLAKEIKSRSLDNVIGVDVFNEPHQLYWYQPHGEQPAWVDVIAKAAEAVYYQHPGLLLFVEGSASDGDPDTPLICSAQELPQDANAYSLVSNSECRSTKQVLFKSNWGENFKPLLDKDKAREGFAVFDEKRFREAVCSRTSAEVCEWLLGKEGEGRSKGHLVFSPHIYGQAVAQWQSTPQASPYRFDWNFGFLQAANKPIVIGETGYRPEALTDLQFFHDAIVPYLQSHQLNHHLFYWTFNSNSGDTGGVREGPSSPRLILEKEQALHDLFAGE